MATLESAADFTALDALEQARPLRSLLGRRGLLLGFVGDVWMPSSVLLLRWLTRETTPLRRIEVATAALVGNAPHTLHGFLSASPLPPGFPLLADADRTLHALYNMAHAGVILIDADLCIRGRWLMTADALPRPKAFLRTVEAMGLEA